MLLNAVKDLVGRNEKRAAAAHEWLCDGGWFKGGEFSVQVLGIRPSILRNLAEVLTDQRSDFTKRVKFNAEAVIKALIEAGDQGDEQDDTLS